MWRTGLACACLALLAWLASSWVTHGFQVWTAEGARRLEVALQPVAAPAVRVEGPELAPQTLPQLLADGRSATIVDFVYTRCRSVCSVLGSQFQQMQAALRDEIAAGGPAGVKLLSVSFDPHDDTEVLRAYAESLKADPALWRFARVPDDRAREQLLARFQVVVIPAGPGEFEHNAALLVVDGHGRLVRIFDYEELPAALAFARALRASPDPR